MAALVKNGAMTTQLKIDFVSDVSCPWCAVGLGALEAALARVAPDVKAELHFQPFELNPQMPKEGQDTFEHLNQKYGSSREQQAESREMIRARGAAVGFKFSAGGRPRIYNTFDAHRLLHWAELEDVDKQIVLKKSLLKAYFTEGRHVGRVPDLVELAVEVGLDADEAREALESHRHLDDVRADQAQAMAYGIQGVPFFVIDERFGISGAQDPTVFASALGEALAARDGDTVRVVAGEEATR